MKRSKIFLAVTTALLAVVGVVEARAHKAFFPRTFYTSMTPVPCITPFSASLTTEGNDSRTSVGFTKAGCEGKHLYIPEE
jgi:hypothetical protein